MFGWEYPPVKSGGLGTACYGLSKEIAAMGHDIIFIAPYAIKSELSQHLDLISTRKYRLRLNFKEISRRIVEKLKLPSLMKKHVTYEFVDSLLTPYLTEKSYKKKISAEQEYIKNKIQESNNELGKMVESYEVIYDKNIKSDFTDDVYGKNLMEEVKNYSMKAEAVARGHDYELIVAHDWMTFEAAIRAKYISGKPLAVHIHATEFDRTGGSGVNQAVYDLERWGMEEADIVIANSYVTKDNCVKYYGINPEKIIPVHLAIDDEQVKIDSKEIAVFKKANEKVVLFLGRMTMQKGPEYFLKAAAKALKFLPDIRIVMAGSGDKLEEMIDLAAELGIADRTFFTGFLKGDDIQRIFKMTDLFVLSSIAEPFGLVVLEAIKSGVPCLVSNRAGVAEVLSHVLKVNFWDIDDMADKMVSVLKHNALHQNLKEFSESEANEITWRKTAEKTIEAYSLIAKKEYAYA